MSTSFQSITTDTFTFGLRTVGWQAGDPLRQETPPLEYPMGITEML
jgi:hypothetical protein